jgi:deoxyribonuclease-2
MISNINFFFKILIILFVIRSICSVTYLDDLSIEDITQSLNNLRLESKNKNIQAGSANCVSPTGSVVDWYFIFLMNKSHSKYVYMDNTMKESKVFELVTQEFPPLKIATSLNSKNSNYIVWNDDSITEPEKPYSKMAHSKGIIAYGKENGIYLVHSLPKFPEMNVKEIFLNDLPANQGSYSQTFLCATFDKKNLFVLIDTLKDIKAGVQSNYYGNKYDKDLDDVVAHFDSNLNKRSKGNEITIESVTTLGGVKMEFFAKPKSVLELPWDNHIPNHYKENFFVGTWTRPELLAPICKKYKTINILSYSVKEMAYKNTQDHSKWAYSKNIFCVGDLNRTNSQLIRSGTILCMKNELVIKEVSKFSKEVDSC